MGRLIDKMGPRKMAIFGAVVVGIGYALLSRMTALWMLYVLFGVVIALGFNAGFSHAASAAVANWFIRKRGRALGLYTLGAGVGGATLVPLIGWLISQYGWRTTVVIIGVGVWVIVIPLSLVLRHRPEQYGYVYDTTGSYYSAFMLFALLYLLGVGILPFIKRPKPPTRVTGYTTS